MNYWIFHVGYNGSSTITINNKRRKLIRKGSCLLQLMTSSDSPVVMYILCLGLTKCKLVVFVLKDICIYQISYLLHCNVGNNDSSTTCIIYLLYMKKAD